jgi:probable selenium-dependent hydroxylase accessory protein YqeC
MEVTEAFSIKDYDVITLVGGGGKVTTMFKIAQEFSDRGKTVITTLTTEMFVSDGKKADTMVLSRDIRSLSEKLKSYINKRRIITVASGYTKQVKLKGITPKSIEEIAKIEGVNLILVKGDGASQKSFKAPAKHEPVIPSCTRLVIPVIGIDVIGKLLNEKNTHRPHIISKLAGVEMGSTITSQVIASVLSHPLGGLKRVPKEAKIIPLVNKVESLRDLNVAKEIARLVLENSQRIDAVVIGHVRRKDPVISVVKRI